MSHSASVQRIDGVRLYFDDLHHWRTVAKTKIYVSADDPMSQVGEVPDYFADRIGYREYRISSGAREMVNLYQNPIRINKNDYIQSLRQFLVGVDDLALLPIDPEEQVPFMPLLDELLYRWRTFLKRHSVPVPNTAFQNPAGLTWHEFFAKSVHYPERPAIAGPTFFSRLTRGQRNKLLIDSGANGLIARYAFLMQTHEEMHTYQAGEPLLCEFFLSLLWCNFLTDEDEWHWQRNAETETSFNLEFPYVHKLNINKDILVSYSLDCSEIVKASCRPDVDPRVLYEKLMVTASRFDSGEIRYNKYLGTVSDLLLAATVK